MSAAVSPRKDRGIGFSSINWARSPTSDSLRSVSLGLTYESIVEQG